MSIHLKKMVLSITLAVFLCSMMPGNVMAEITLKIGGTGSALGSMKLMAEAFQESHPGMNIVILPSLGSGGGISAVSEGALDIGLSSRPLKQKEQSPELQVIEYARTPLAPVANSSVHITGVNDKELLQIYRGDMVNWPQGIRLRLIMRPAGESDTAALKHISSDMASAVDSALGRPGMIITTTDQENADVIEHLTGAFGFITLSQIISENRNVKILSYNGIFPGVQSLSDRSYPLFKPLYFITRTGTSDPVRLFFDFVRSDKGKAVLERSGNFYVMDMTVK